MAKNLVIVESPAKSKTITKFLGKGFMVKASMGHIRDLPKSKMGIDTEGSFDPEYITSPDKRKVISELKADLKGVETLWIATDEDREGEAIGWHLLAALKVPKKTVVKRIVFHEITKSAILNAVENPREMNMDLVDAQQARRVLDRLVGYELSPLLWKKVRYGLSAGRVQSVAVRLIVEREREIKAFEPKEYWSLGAHMLTPRKDDVLFKLDKREINNEKESKEVLADLEKANFEITALTTKEAKRNPYAPFITSTLQQDASRKLRYTAKKTMMIAQQLYEGIDIGHDHVGLITYMRTDSVNLSSFALGAAEKFIKKEYGEKYHLRRTFKSKKGAQEAHEAIRPVDIMKTPESLRKVLSADQYKLYDLIWRRTVASQMSQALYEQMRVEMDVAGKSGESYLFKATGQRQLFDGFMRVYQVGKDDHEDEEKDFNLPEMNKGEDMKLKEFEPLQHFTKPPARYTEASLIKVLEAEGIGRPSTYAPTISTIQTRGYVEREKRYLKPTDTGEVVTDVLVEHFNDIVDIHFTAKMEEKLDHVAHGEVKWQPVIKEFYVPFHKNIIEKEKTIKKADIVKDKTDEVCEKCKEPMEVKLGRFGKFLSCTGYPNCKNAKPLHNDNKPKLDEALEKKLSGKKCEKCDKEMEIKKGRYGEFLSCTGYPDCKNNKPIVKFIDVDCPECKSGQLIERRTRKGAKIFYGCNKFPKCKYATWADPRKKEDKEEGE